MTDPTNSPTSGSPLPVQAKLLLVLGMHRSGTSAMAGVLELLGLSLGEELLPPADDNPKGFFENARIVAIQQGLLRELGLDWHDPAPLPEGWLDERPTAEAGEAIEAELREMAAHGDRLAVKDPRSSRLVPLWRRIAERLQIHAGAIVMVRDPREVVASLQRRDGFEFRKAALLWLRHMLEAERFSRGMRRCFVEHVALFADWRGQLARIEDQVGIALPVGDRAGESIEAFLDPTLMRRREPPVPDLHVELASLLADAERAFLALCRGDDVPAHAFDRLLERTEAHYAEYETLLRADRNARAQAQQAAAVMQLWAGDVTCWEPATARLYWRGARQGYAEERAVMCFVHDHGEGFHARFVLPEDAEADFVRFDPDDLPGAFVLTGFEFCAKRIARPEDLLVAVGEMRLPAPGGMVRWAALGPDPYLEFDIRPLTRDGSVALHFRYRRETAAGIVAEQRQAVLALDAQVSAASLAQQQAVAALRARIDGLQRAAEAQSTAIDHAVAALGARIDGLQRAAEAQRTLIDQAFAALQRQLAAMHEEQRLVRMWAQHRSPGYWWRRLRRFVTPGGADQPIVVEPLANVRHEQGREWVAENHDPQLRLRRGGGARFEAGWYQLRGRLRTIEGELTGPCAYADYGDGYGERSLLPLPGLDPEGCFEAVLLLTEDARDLRWDPGNAPARFVIEELSLRRIGRMRAGRLMVRHLAAAGGGPSGGAQALLAAVSRFARRDVRAAGDELRRRYLASFEGPATEYSAWILKYDARDERRRAEWCRQLEELPRRPLLSVLLPTYDTPEKWLRKAIESVLAQVYPDWELCIADDASRKPHVRRVLQEYAARDPRIRVCYRDRNGHIAEASNSALALANGEFVALLDHDDELAPHALLEVAKAICANPKWRMIYSDEDKIDEAGRRFDPYFKPDWNYELLLAQNCVSHLGVYRTDLVRESGGFRRGLEGSQDWDLALRVSERLGPDEIGHIPAVLYHWRAIGGSTALGVGEKNYAVEAGRRAVQEHLQRTGQAADVDVHTGGHLIVRRRLTAPPPVSLIIPTRDKVQLLRTCVQSILAKTDYPSYQLLIVDNQSVEPETHAYFESLAGDDRVRVLRYDAPFNYSAINNYAAAQATGELLALVNNDIEVISGDWLREMAAHAVRPGVGAVGALLLYPNDTIQHAGVVLGLGGVAGHIYTGKRRDYGGYFSRALFAQEMSAVTAACLLVRKAVFDQVGGLDERLSVAFNDIDFCLRVRAAGYRNLWTPRAVLYHHESASRGYEDTPEKVARFTSEVRFMHQRWGATLQYDPAYNRNLSLSGEPFTLAFPPR